MNIRALWRRIIKPAQSLWARPGVKEFFSMPRRDRPWLTWLVFFVTLAAFMNAALTGPTEQSRTGGILLMAVLMFLYFLAQRYARRQYLELLEEWKKSNAAWDQLAHNMYEEIVKLRKHEVSRWFRN